MRHFRLRFLFWCLGLVALFLLANLRRRPFTTVLLLFWLCMPILSLIGSLLFRNRLHMKWAESKTVFLSREERAHVDLILESTSGRFPFFLHFPSWKDSDKKHGHRAMQITLQPNETRRIPVFYRLPHTGAYALRLGRSYFEDILGLFRIGVQGGEAARDVYALPRRDALPDLARHIRDLLEDEVPLEQRSLTHPSDELFAVEPRVEGESLRHAHWKLSARMQTWMIRHYTDLASLPLCLIVDVPPVATAPSLRFTKNSRHLNAQKTTEEKTLTYRDTLLDAAMTIADSALQSGRSLVVSHTDQPRVVLRLDRASMLSALAEELGAIPFIAQRDALAYDARPNQRVLLLTKSIDADLLGYALALMENGSNVRFLAFQSETPPEALHALKQAGVPFDWLEWYERRQKGEGRAA